MLRSSFISLALVFAALLASVMSPETANAEQFVSVTQTQHLGSAEGDHHGEEGGGMPCDAGLHHHCSVAIAYGGGAESLTTFIPTQVNAAFVVHPLLSRSLAPPTEPPAA